MFIESGLAEKEAVLVVAEKMCIAARTAPKTRGIDRIITAVLTEIDLEKLAAEMDALGHKHDEQFRTRNIRDAKSVRNSDAVVLIGTKTKPRGITFCSFCGFENCSETQQKGGHCAFDDIDLGIALGSAVSIAADNRIDNRVMFSVGKTAMEMHLLGNDVNKILGIPLSVSGKNKYFDLGAFHPSTTGK